MGGSATRTSEVATVVSKDGTPIAYERSGEGPPLVLVHGTTSDRSTWEPVLPELQKHFTVYAGDRRGRGESGDGGGSAYDIEREFEDVVAVIDSIGEEVCLLGNSYGAICALEAALRSNRVRRLVLYEGGFPVAEGTELYRPEVLDSVRSSLEAGDLEGALTTFYRDMVLLSPEEIEMLRSSLRESRRRGPGRGATRQPDRRDAPSGASRPQNGAGPVRARGYAVPDAGVAPESASGASRGRGTEEDASQTRQKHRIVERSQP
jgi:pimeloyl-ACP methyl ester carboxylesterase